METNIYEPKIEKTLEIPDILLGNRGDDIDFEKLGNSKLVNQLSTFSENVESVPIVFDSEIDFNFNVPDSKLVVSNTENSEFFDSGENTNGGYEVKVLIKSIE